MKRVTKGLLVWVATLAGCAAVWAVAAVVVVKVLS
jgi:hypothetical protein